MADDLFFGDDPFGTQSVTPVFDSLHTKGTEKLLVVIFVVDCSKTMSGDRIGAVNAAMQELKYKLTEIKNDNGLDLRIAILSFASSAKWELELTPIDQVSLDAIHTRPGLTEYGAAFHELNKVLRKEAYMKHTGKVAPPAIMFLTDGEPEDDYQADLNELMKNGWFANASRSAVLLGDAINNDSAKSAVRQFVNDADEDIVTAEDSTVIIQRIKIATMHTIAGDPMRDNIPNKGNDFDMSSSVDAGRDDGTDDSPVGPLIFDDDVVPVTSTLDTDPAKTSDGPFGGNSSTDIDPDPFPLGNNPVNDANKSSDQVFGDAASTGGAFGNASVDTDNPFGNSIDDNDPFGDGGDPFGGLI